MAGKSDHQVVATAVDTFFVRRDNFGMQSFATPPASHTIGTFGTEVGKPYQPRVVDIGELEQPAGFNLDDVAALTAKSSGLNSRQVLNVSHPGQLQTANLGRLQQPSDFTAPSVNTVESRHQSSHRGAQSNFVSPLNSRRDTWEDSVMADTSPRTDTSTDVDTDDKGNQKLDIVQHGGSSGDRSNNKSGDQKTLRRLAQNREAARKSRLRKKAYVQQLESSRLKLTQLEQELQRARQQGIFIAGGVSGDQSHSIGGNGALAFDMEYARWLDDQHRQINDLRAAVNSHVGDNELRVLVDGVMAHYDDIFRLKNVAAKSDVFHMVSGMWKTPAERCFMWMGGFRPSELLKMLILCMQILIPHLEPLTEQQLICIDNLQHSSQQAEDALSQGMEALQQSLAETLASGSLGSSGNVANYMGQMAIAMGKLGTLENFVQQADNLRQQTLQQMHRILTTRQAARALLAISDYFSCLRALSSLWLARPRE
ncbi:transcription factor TGA2.3 isoform X1 [Cryptomeria japonica]|uniref:transcription factor TGA2.3 isoform X1 n=1 Tax=Cryptomeria japonica TaxID=3369 RepID=UPI0027DAB470|nr:transcription factor TGA2.3 isoform X1 [Cryptomeria japonica]